MIGDPVHVTFSKEVSVGARRRIRAFMMELDREKDRVKMDERINRLEEHNRRNRPEYI